MAVRTPQQILLLGGMRIVRWNIIHMGAVASELPADSAGISANELCNLSVAEAVYIISSYTTALFYAKMLIVHTDLLFW